MAQEGEFIRDTGWIAIQKRTFTRWVNQHIAERMLKIEDLSTDLENGISLINLLEIISSKKIPRYNKNPKMRPQCLENNSYALGFLKAEGIKLVAIGPEDIVDHQTKLILGLIWTIILRYHIQKGDGAGSAKNELLQWVRRQIPECDVTNFTTSWQNGKAICHLTDSLERGCIPGGLDAVDAKSDPLANAMLGEDTAESALGIPKVLLPEDMVSPETDELSVMTYISYFRDYQDNLAKRRSKEEKEKTAVPEKTIAFGTGLTEGEQFIPAEFTIQARNCFGTDCPASGEIFDVVIKSPKKGTIPAQVVDHHNDDGKYTVTYTPLDPGRHIIEIKLKGQGISGSPYNVPIAKTSVVAVGPGVEKAEQYTPAEFTIQAAKLFQAGVLPGEGEFDIKIKGTKSTVEPTIVNHNDGNFVVSYTPTESGRHVIDVQLKDRPIGNGPFSVPVEKTLCTAAGPGLEKGEQFIPAKFTISAVPLFQSGNSGGVADFDVKISSPKGNVVPRLTDNHDGTFEVEYHPTEVGRYNVAITLKGIPISNGPWSVPISQTGCSATGPGLEKGEQFVPSEFNVSAKPLVDNGVPVTAEDIDVKVAGPLGQIPVQITPNADGTFAVNFTPKDTGRHNLTVAVKGQPILATSVPINKTSCTAGGPGLEKAEQYLPAAFNIDVSPIVNAGGTVSPDEVVVKIAGPHGAVEPTIKSTPEGKWEVTYTPKEVGPHTVSVAIKGQDIAQVSVPVSKTFITAQGPGLENAEQFIPAHFTINAENLVKSGFSNGAADFDVKVAGPKGPIEALVVDNKDGTFSVTYTPKDFGKAQISVLAKGQPINNGPFNVNIDKTSAKAYGPGLEKAEQFVPAHFTVDASPLTKAEVPVNPEDIQVRLNGPRGPTEATIVPNNDGTFSVTYTPKDIGKFTVQVLLKGTEIANVAIPIGKTQAGASGAGLDKAEQFIPATFSVDATPLTEAGVLVTPEDITNSITGPNGAVPVEVTPDEDKPGVFNVTFVPKDVGPHRILTTLKGQEILNKPVIVAKTTASVRGPGLENGEQFIPAHFTVDASPLAKAGVPATPDDISVNITGPQGKVEAVIDDKGDGTFEVTYTPKEVGRHNLQVALKGQELDRRSVPVQKTSTTATGPGLEKAEQFIPAVFQVDASGLVANDIPLVPEDLEVKVNGPQGPIEPVIELTPEGKFNVTWTPKDIARHTVQVALKGTPITNASVPVSKTGVNASGPGLEKAEQFIPASFTVDGTPLTNAGVPFHQDELVVRITGPTGNPVDATIVPGEQEGTFNVTYVPQEIGKVAVNVVVKGQEIANKPVFVTKTTCGASGPGLEKATQFLPATFTVETQPLAKAGVPAQPEDILVKVTGPQGPVDVQITPNEDGSFNVVYTPVDVGRQQIEVALKGTPILNKSVPATKSGITVNGDGINKAEQYIPSDFDVDARELKEQGVAPEAEDFEVKIQAPSGADLPVDVQDNKDGTYSCKYTPVEPGRHKLSVGLKGRPILPNHIIPVDKSSTDPSKCTAEGPGIEPTGIVIDKPTHFTIQARNKIGDPMKTGGDPFKVDIAGPYNSTVEPQITDNNDGTYNVVYEPNVPGDYNVNVSLNGTPIKDAPFSITAERGENDADPAKFDVYGPGLEKGDTAEPSIFTIVAKNSKGEPIVHGGHPITVEVYGPTQNILPIELLDNQDGTYTVTYQAVDPGPHQVDVLLHTKVPVYYDHIKDSPYKPEIIAGTDAAASLAWGPGLEDVYDTKPAEFYIKAKDRDGNDMGRGGDPFLVTVTGPSGAPIPASVDDNGDGTYNVHYDPTEAGDHKVEVTLRGKSVAKSPYTVNVKEGAAWEHTVIERYQFLVRSKTKAGTNKTVGGEKLEVKISSSETTVFDLLTTDKGDGSYLVDYTLPSPGDYTISVKLNGHDIVGSPFSQKTPN